MSIKAMSYVWDNSKQQGTALLCLLALADYANDEGIAYPGMTALAKRCRIKDRKNLKRILEKLVEDGEIIIEVGAGMETRYGATNRYLIVGYRASINACDLQQETGKRQGATRRGVKQPGVTQPPVQGVTLPPLEGVKTPPLEGVTEPPNPPIVDPSSYPPMEPSVKSLTPQQEMFGKVCEIIGWDYQTLDKASRGQIAQTVGILSKAGYTVTDLDHFWDRVWKMDWRWTNKHSRPNLTQLRQEIGKVRQMVEPPPVTVQTGYTNGSRRLSKTEESMAAVDRVFARLEAQGIFDEDGVIDAEAFYGDQE